MMRKNNNRGGNNKHRGGNNGGRRYGNNNSGGNRSNQNDSQNLQRQKHHATQQLGKYSDMARNAQINGDRVDVEYYLQHMDHYTRVLTDIAAIEAERFAHNRESQIIPGGPNDPNAQMQDMSANGSESANSEGGEAVHDAQGEGAQQPSQSRHQRPRRSYSSSASNEPSPLDNGTHEANSNTTEIPLPGGIIPPI